MASLSVVYDYFLVKILTWGVLEENWTSDTQQRSVDWCGRGVS